MTYISLYIPTISTCLWGNSNDFFGKILKSDRTSSKLVSVTRVLLGIIQSTLFISV